MELTVNGDKIAGLVSNRQIEQSIRSLTGEGDSFAILARGEQVYIQTSAAPSDGFLLEYRDGSENEHYSCSNFELTADQVIRAFQSYLADDGRWKSELEWQPQVFDYLGRSGSGRKVLVAIGLLIAGLVVWKVFFSA